MVEHNIQLSQLATNHYYNLFWRLGFRNLVTVLVPFFGMLIMNLLIVKKLKQARQTPQRADLADPKADSPKVSAGRG